jgi:8-oxo-dGTP pyrophosphatase MutT (NUDIX family)
MSKSIQLYNDVVSFETGYSEELVFKQRVLDLLQQLGDEAFSRQHFEPGHITASGFIVNKDATKMLLVQHTKLNLWLQPGGHLDEGETTYAACVREVAEETFLKDIESDGMLFDIDIHLIPTNKGLPPHSHFDIRYLFYVDEELPVDISEESLAIQWVKLEDVQSFNNSDSMVRPVQKIQKLGQKC